MSRPLAGLLGAALVGIPLLTSASWPVLALAAVAGGLCGAGVALLVPALLTAGAALALGEYAVALSLSPAPADFVTAIALGVVLLLFLDVAEFASRFRGAAVDPRAVRGQVRYWVGWAGIAAILGLVLATAAAPMAFGLPGWAYPVIAGVGALAVGIGIVRVLTLGAGPTE